MDGSSRSESSADSTDEDERKQREHSSRCAGAYRRRNTRAIVARPNASRGYWICCLLPLSLISQYARATSSEMDDCFESDHAQQQQIYEKLTIAAVGMCVESLCFYLYKEFDSHLLIKLLLSFVPGVCTSGIYVYLLQFSWPLALPCGFAITFVYQNVYIRVMRGLPCTFSYGEAAVLVQGLMLFVMNCILNGCAMFSIGHLPETMAEFMQLNIIMMYALLCLLITCVLLAYCKLLRKPLAFYPLMLLLVLAVTCTPIVEPLPVVMLFKFIVMDITRLKIISLCFMLVGVTALAVWWQLRNSQKASTSTRKIFHLVIVLVYIPGILYQCAFLYIASGVALAMFTVLELIRVLNMPPFAAGLKAGFVAFSDEKDAGLLALTPFCLLIGCSMPIWIYPCPCSQPKSAFLPLMSGILAIGIGDTAASVIGSKFGTIKWRNSNRTLEGSTAFVIAILVTLACFELSGVLAMTSVKWLFVLSATLVCALMEALTDQIDNLVLPLAFYAIVSWA